MKLNSKELYFMLIEKSNEMQQCRITISEKESLTMFVNKDSVIMIHLYGTNIQTLELSMDEEVYLKQLLRGTTDDMAIDYLLSLFKKDM